MRSAMLSGAPIASSTSTCRRLRSLSLALSGAREVRRRRAGACAACCARLSSEKRVFCRQGRAFRAENNAKSLKRGASDGRFPSAKRAISKPYVDFSFRAPPICRAFRRVTPFRSRERAGDRVRLRPNPNARPDFLKWQYFIFGFLGPTLSPMALTY